MNRRDCVSFKWCWLWLRKYPALFGELTGDKTIKCEGCPLYKKKEDN